MEPSKKEPEPSLRRPLGFAGYQTSQKEANLKQQNETDEIEHLEAHTDRIPPEQIQELLDLVIGQGLSARKAGFNVGIVERTAQHYVKQCKDDTEKRLPGQRKQTKRVGKLESCHTEFLCSFFAKRPEAVLWQARDALLDMFSQIGSINLSSLHKHLVLQASLTFKKLELVVAAITAQSTLELKRERVLERQNDSSMNWNQNCVSIDEADFNMHIRRNFDRSKKGMSVKSVVPSNRGVTVTIIDVQKKTSGTKKRKRYSGKADDVEVNAREGTQSEHFLDFLSSLINTLDQFGMQDSYLIMDNAAIRKVDEFQELIASRGYKTAYLPPYSPFLNPIELFWSKIKGNIRRDCLSADDNLSLRITEATKKVTQQHCAN
ncbi:hypothetical protein G6F37_000903 [Rhizopus arrhizus]|nr:hypothetical protein G6F38_009419 [Rhizopus arrhizus]KAG1163767.1 hypothetical protein G6F37_000903 [Rhizopus arrhizus]